MSTTREAVDQLSRDLTDKGRLIEAGWVGLKAMWLPPGAPEEQVAELRAAFFAGAQHLFSSIMTILEPGDEPTEADLKRMDAIQSELDEFITVFSAESLPTEGSA